VEIDGVKNKVGLGGHFTGSEKKLSALEGLAGDFELLR